MKTKIRKSVFETNSSSSHSISISDDTTLLMDTDLIPDQDGVIELTGGEFGWEWRKYNDALTKANYAAVFSKHNDDWRKLLVEVIVSQTGAINVKFQITEDSYIDHQSDAGEGGEATEAFESEESLRQFIFNKNSWLFTGNDNDTADPTFYDVPVFKDGKKIMPKYKYELKIDGYKETTRFKESPSPEELRLAFDSLLRGVELYDNGGNYHFDNDRSIYAQIMKSQSGNIPFEFNYDSEITDEYVEFRKETWRDANEKCRKEFGKDDYDKCKEIEKQLIKDHPEKYVRKIKYQLVSCKQNLFEKI